MTESPHTSSDSLWRRLAEAQDAAIDGVVDTRSARSARLNGRSRRLRPAVLVAGALAAACVVIAVQTAPRVWRAGTDRTDPLGAAGRVVLTDARSDLPLQFSDGSTLTFRAGSAGGVQRLGDTGADVVLDRGRLDAHVVHADSTLWLVHAGPFKVRVTGTRFTVRWSPRPAPAQLEVAVFEGSVMIDGAALGAGVPLGAGHRLTVQNGVVRTDLIAHRSEPPTQANEPETANAPDPSGEPPMVSGDDSPTASAGDSPRAQLQAHGLVRLDDRSPDAMPAPQVASTSPTRARLSRRAHDGDWLPPARRGAYGEAHSRAKRRGWDGLCGRLDARRLLMLGDVARYAGAPVDAERAFGSLVARYPGHRLAGDALFSLGRLAFEAGRPGKAAGWFRRYVDEWPKGPLVDQALGRLMESAVRAEDDAGARSAAETYLERAPHGPHAPLAREVLEGLSDRTP